MGKSIKKVHAYSQKKSMLKEIKKLKKYTTFMTVFEVRKHIMKIQ